ncbi:hypothetical protein B0H17DRAFT_1130028 [Mycena rosella]|uniref:CxC2-like cysteine cluster KDZ transposase-associated domain-containing protein n=1 Tax=Mycena rosella TaxID=1033263 RepID=A0AAD7DRL6_MYCRO|nr:hypothetical protein B0H17DRAFT_1130028 [Mycena rosella]
MLGEFLNYFGEFPVDGKGWIADVANHYACASSAHHAQRLQQQSQLNQLPAQPCRDAVIGFDAVQGTTDLTADCRVYISNNSLRRVSGFSVFRVVDKLLNIGQKRRCLHPDKLKDDLASWVPVDDTNLDLDPELLAEMEHISGMCKRKRYQSLNDLMAQWQPMKQFFLDETLCREGLGNCSMELQCGLCDMDLNTEPASAPADAAGHKHFFHCGECGEFLQCQECCLARHKLTPLHFLKTGRFWKAATLLEISLVYQVGRTRCTCPSPAPARSMVVIDTMGIHTVKFQYCGCNRKVVTDNLHQLLSNTWYPVSLMDPGTCATFNVLDFFRLLTMVGNVNACNFMMSLEHRTDGLLASGLKSTLVHSGQHGVIIWLML